MDKYLIEILHELSTIVIPDFGALSILNKETGEISFVPFFKHNDGQLSKYISQKEGITELEATNLIAKYVREIEAKLNQGESYDIYQFGSFRKSATGLISFTQTTKQENFKEVSNPTQNEPVETENEIQTIQDTFSKDEKPELTVQSVGSENESLSSTDTATYSVEEQWNDDLDLPPVGLKKEEPIKPILEKMESRSKRKGPVFYGLLISFVLLLGGLSIYMLFYNSLEKKLPLVSEKSIQETDSTLIKEEIEKNEQLDSTQMEFSSSAENEGDSNQAETNESSQEQLGLGNSVNQSAGPYHIIAGAFTDSGNAERFSQKLKDLGFDSKIVATINGLNMVSIASFLDKESAKSGLQEVSSSAPGGWILYAP